MSKHVATILAQIICFDNKLPQGACTSPVVANMISKRMDSSFIKLAKHTGSRYTRYVDDVTFSSTKKSLSQEIVSSFSQIPNKDIVIGESIQKIIHDQGFSIKHKKTRLQSKMIRQEVTGVVINEFPNVRREFVRSVRMMLHTWKKYKLKEASANFRKNHYNKKSSLDDESLFKAVIVGRISHIVSIRGRLDPVSYTLCKMYQQLEPDSPKLITEICEMSKKYKVFIGHASEDKAEVAKPLYDELLALEISSFFDAVDIKWGDSITQKINKALGEADIFLAIISKSSQAKLWPQKEVNAALARTIEGKQTFLPLFVGSKEEIVEMRKHYSLISDLLYKEWSGNPQELATEISGMVL